MSVVTVQPSPGGQKQDIDDQPPSYSELQPGYAAAGQVYGQPQPAFGAPPGQQQQPMGWMPIPTSNISFGCPPGLEYLATVDHILVKQFLGFTNNERAYKCKITNALNQQVYFASEELELCQGCCNNARGYTMQILDNCGKEVIRVNRPFKSCSCCCCCCCWCWCANSAGCSPEVEVEAPVGQVIGRVRQTQSFWLARYDIISPNDDVLLKIRGPKCVADGNAITNDQDFNIFTPDMSQSIGKISKKPIGFYGFVRQMFNDKYDVSYPMNLDVKMKATLLGALFLIDSMFFRNNKNYH